MKLLKLLLLLLVPVAGFSQNITMTGNGSSTQCTGNFYDSGGAALNGGGAYDSDESFVWTICPSSPGLISLNFTDFDVESNYDFLEVFDGNSVAGTSLGTYHNLVPLLGVVQATSANATGCLTFRFTSDGSGEEGGWVASISCVEPCQAVQALISSIVPAETGGIVKLCQGDGLSFNGSATFPENNLYYAQSTATSTYAWTLTGAAGTSTFSTQNASTTYPAEGVYHVSLDVTDVNGCVSTNAEEILIEVSTTPIFTGTTATQPSICIGATNTIVGFVAPVTFTEDCSPTGGAQISLPDGTGVSYTNSTTISCYASGLAVTNANQIASVCMNMEHSYVGDLDITITCPTGQSIILIDYETGTNTSGEFLGVPVDDDATPTVVGTGANYCFTSTATQTINTACASIANSVMIPAGNYLPIGAFTGLIGCEFNGDWTITIKDNLGSDNGTIFYWSVDFANVSTTTQTIYTPTVVAESFQADATIVSTSGNSITVQPTAVGTSCYAYEMTDDFGCTYDTTVCFTVVAGPVLVITDPLAVCEPSTVDITVAAVTAGSTGGGTLTYWTDAACTIAVGSPAAITTSGTYYIKATSGSCVDIEPVVVEINPIPVLVITSPAAVCAPLTIDITDVAVTAGSTGGGTLTYWTDVTATTSLASPAAVTTSGTYYIKSTLGTCTDIEPVTVTVNPSPVLVITSPAAVCSPGTIDITLAAVTAGSTGGGTLTYWTDATCTSSLGTPTAITTSGTYYIKSTLGTCEDIEPVIVTISPPPVLTITNPTAVCAPLTIDVTDVAVTAGSTGAGTLTYWTDAACTASLGTPTAISTSGTYYILSTVGSCTDVESVIVTVNPSPVLIITTPADVCAPSTVDITLVAVTAGSTGGGTLTYWTDAACTATLGSPTTISTSGTYYIKSTLGTCFDIEAVVVTVNPIPVLTISNPAAVCMPLTIDLTDPAVTAGSTGGGVLTYWTDAAGTISLASPSTAGTSGTYYIQSTLGTCFDIEPVTIAVNDCSCPVILVVTNPTAVCSPLTVDLTLPAVTAGSTGGGTLTYWTDAACTSPLVGENAISVSNVYYIKSDDGSCSDVKPVTITINPTPVLTITDPTEVCAPLTVDLTLSAVTAGSTGGGTLTYWTDLAATTTLTTSSTVATSGTYYIQSALGTCTDIEAVIVEVNETPVLTITDPTEVCAPLTIDITDPAVTAGSIGGGTLTYWTDAAATISEGSPSVIATSGIYYIQSALGTCTDIEAVNVVVNVTPVLTITDPTEVCAPLTVDITDPAVTTGSTGAGTLTYWTDAAATISEGSPSVIATSGIYYIQSALGTCTDIEAVNVVVNTTPVLTITDPGAVCVPGVVDITDPTVTAGSTGAGTLTYWTNAAATIPEGTPTAITASGTFYIQSSLGTCSDLEMVNVIISSAPVLVITDPTAVCSPVTVDITDPAVTAGSTGTGSVLTYWTDALCTASLGSPTTVSTSGTYYIKSSIGSCEDIASVTVTVNPTPNLVITNPAAVCFPSTVDLTDPAVTTGSTGGGTLSYWTDVAATIPEGTPTAIAASGTFYIQSSLGTCSDLEMVSVIISSTPVLVITDPAAVCSPTTVDITDPAVTAGSTGVGNVLTYWTDALCTSSLGSPTTVSTSGTYYIKSSIGSCEDIASVNVTVNPTPSLVITNPVAVCFPSTVDITDPAVTAGSTGAGTLTYWTDVAATIPEGNPAAIAASGTFYIKSTLGACFDIESVLVVVNATPVLALNNPAEVCSPTTVDLTAPAITAGSTGGGVLTYWTDAACTSSLSSFNSLSTSGTYYIKSSLGACTDNGSVSVIVSTTPSLIITNPAAVCSPATVDITDPAVTAGSTGGGTLSYWTNAACTSPLASPNSVSVSGTYYIKSTVSICDDIEPVIVTINAPVLPLFTQMDSICQGSNTPFFQTNSYNIPAITGSWSPSVDITLPGSTTYTFTPTAGQCATTTTMVLVVKPLPILDIITPGDKCSPERVDLTLAWDSTTSNGTIGYYSNPSGQSEIVNPTSIASSGTYYIKSTSNLECPVIFPVTVVINPKPVASFMPSPTVLNTYNTTSTMINSSTGAVSYQWYFMDGDSSDLENPEHLFPDTVYTEQLITLIATSQLGCKDTTIGYVKLNEELIFYVPNAFTPDGDKFNQTFQPVFTSGYDPYDFAMYIFNRWGEIIFETHDATIGWNGTYGGGDNIIQDGVHTWKIEFKIKGVDKHQVEIGHVNILR